MARLQTLAPRVRTIDTRATRPATVSDQQRTRGGAWMRIRAQVLARDAGLCQVCKAAGRLTLAAEVDHIRELADGGTDEPANLQAICRPCHVAKTTAGQLARSGQG